MVVISYALKFVVECMKHKKDTNDEKNGKKNVVDRNFEVLSLF